MISIPQITFKESASLFENLPKANKSETIKPMEAFNQGWGRILYRTQLPESTTSSKIKITELHDWAAIFINGKRIGNLDRRKDENTIEIPPVKKGDVLDILVDAMGRVNYGKTIIDLFDSSSKRGLGVEYFFKSNKFVGRLYYYC
jgi:beta-galactosidase